MTRRVHIRWMIRPDLPQVMEIERQSFEYPWFEEEFIRCLRQRNCIGMVAEHAERVVGFMIYELHKTRLHILNFAVSPEHRLQGVGTWMMDKLKGKMSYQRRSKLTLEVREGNEGAHLFFKRQGFICTEIKRGWFDNSDEDAYYFEYFYDDEDCRRALSRFTGKDTTVRIAE